VDIPLGAMDGPIDREPQFRVCFDSGVFALLYAHRGDNLNLRSTWLCSRNDSIANVAVIASAGAVTGTAWPHALVGGGLALLWLRTSLRVLREAWPVATSGADTTARAGPWR
jgi:Co/Zn/Cd efflux system component